MSDALSNIYSPWRDFVPVLLVETRKPENSNVLGGLRIIHALATGAELPMKIDWKLAIDAAKQCVRRATNEQMSTPAKMNDVRLNDHRKAVVTMCAKVEWLGTLNMELKANADKAREVEAA